MCCDLLKETFPLYGLLHDATEAYLLDIPRPIKLKMPEYKSIEKKLMKVIFQKFGLKEELPDKVKEIDNVALEFEWHHIMIGNKKDLIFLPHKEAKYQFLERFNRYYNGNN